MASQRAVQGLAVGGARANDERQGDDEGAEDDQEGMLDANIDFTCALALV